MNGRIDAENVCESRSTVLPTFLHVENQGSTYLAEDESMPPNHLPRLINHNSPKAVWNEVVEIWNCLFPRADNNELYCVFEWTTRLYKGDIPGFKACNTAYHDIVHTTDTFLTLARLVHGGWIEGYTFTPRQVFIALAATILHDSGYIQEESDDFGTGAKYTKVHVERSIDLCDAYACRGGWSLPEREVARAMIRCTDLSKDIGEIPFFDETTALLGKLIAGADLLAQMADRAYLEKLLFLYHELKEGDIRDFSSEADLLAKTVDFYRFVGRRLEDVFSICDRFLEAHFRDKWGVEENLYRTAMVRQHEYLEKVLEMSSSHPQAYLRRSGIIERVRRKYGE